MSLDFSQVHWLAVAAAGLADMLVGARWGGVLGAGLVAMFVAMIHAFETRPTSLIAIDADYAVAATAVMGAIVGAWQ